MATVEVLFKVGDAAGFPADPTAGQDGMVIGIWPEGIEWTPAEVTAYLDSSTIPPGWLTLSEWEREYIKRHFDDINWMTQVGRTAQEVADVKEPGWDSGSPEEQADTLARMQQQIGLAEGQRFRFETYGYDTNFGYGDLTHHGVVLMTLTDNQILRYHAQSQQQPLDPVAHPSAPRTPRAKAWWRVPYESVPEITPAYIARLADTADRVSVPRGAMTPLLPGFLEDL
jgi:hypothetical protein